MITTGIVACLIVGVNAFLQLTLAAEWSLSGVLQFFLAFYQVC
jgi:hypothetical protein